MSSDKLLEQTLQKTGLPVKYYEYEGVKPEYIIYNEEAEEPADHGDNHPIHNIIWWQVHIFTPKTSDFRKYKRNVIKDLRAAGFYVTDNATMYEKETKTIHVIISCHNEESEE